MFDSMNGIAETAPACCTAGSAAQPRERRLEERPQLCRRRVVVPREHLRDQHAIALRNPGSTLHQPDEAADAAGPRPYTSTSASATSTTTRPARSRCCADVGGRRCCGRQWPARRAPRATPAACPDSSATAADINAGKRQRAPVEVQRLDPRHASPGRAARCADSAHAASARRPRPPSTAMTRLSSSSCWTIAAAPRAKRHAHGNLALARRAARQQQVGDVDAGDEQHERRRRRRAASRRVARRRRDDRAAASRARRSFRCVRGYSTASLLRDRVHLAPAPPRASTPGFSRPTTAQ